MGGYFASDRGAEHKAHQEDALLRSEEEQEQKTPKIPVNSRWMQHKVSILKEESGHG